MGVAMKINAVQVYLPEDCISGACDCEPGDCMFDRCPDCDRLVDGHGMTVDPRGCCFTCKAD